MIRKSADNIMQTTMSVLLGNYVNEVQAKEMIGNTFVMACTYA